MICFYVQGGGLGHITRVDKVIKKLSLKTDEILIITPSQFTHHFPAYQFVHISWKQTVVSWQKTIVEILSNKQVARCFIDTFPFGIKGELTTLFTQFPEIDFIYIARILQWEKYGSAITFGNFKGFKSTLISEKLYATHKKWILQNSEEVINISLVSEENIIPKSLYKTSYVVILHSGGAKDVLALCERAAVDFKDAPEIIFAVFTQVSIIPPSDKFKIYKGKFGVLPYLFDAIHIYSAAGFNTAFELARFRNKHTIIPLEKMYDDQFFRVENNRKQKSSTQP